MTNIQSLRRILLDMQLGKTFDQAERRVVLNILLELAERVDKLERVSIIQDPS